MSENHYGGNTLPEITKEEHQGDMNAKRVFDVVGNSLVPSIYDYISLSYTGTNLTGVVFKTGGSGGTTVSTLTLGYDGSNQLTSVTKS
jgi:hypothetical protein